MLGDMIMQRVLKIKDLHVCVDDNDSISQKEILKGWQMISSKQVP